MSERELRAKYGGKLPKAINRAIRAEIPGGNEALDRLTQLAGNARQSNWKDKSGNDTPEAVEYFKHQREVLGPMEQKVRKRWGVTDGDTRTAPPKPRPRKKRPAVGKK